MKSQLNLGFHLTFSRMILYSSNYFINLSKFIKPYICRHYTDQRIPKICYPEDIMGEINLYQTHNSGSGFQTLQNLIINTANSSQQTIKLHTTAPEYSEKETKKLKIVKLACTYGQLNLNQGNLCNCTLHVFINSFILKDQKLTWQINSDTSPLFCTEKWKLYLKTSS